MTHVYGSFIIYVMVVQWLWSTIRLFCYLVTQSLGA